jgi:sterol desaturase/sphingolipid hydroxylase (fatty acid hydroxylase superfamily)
VTRTWLIEIVYVGSVCALSLSAFSHPDQGFGVREALAMLLTLPALIVALPVIYLVGAVLWSLTGAADAGGPMWPVTVGFTVMFVVTAAAGARLLRLSVSWFRRRSPRRIELEIHP